MEKIKILIPTDFSVQAEFAYLMVKNLGKSVPVNVHFLHVLQVPDTVTMDTSGKISTCGEIDLSYVEKQKEIAEQKLAHLREQYGSEVSTHLVLGKITDGVVSFSENRDIDLVVMGTKGAFGLKEKISGSATQMVARKSLIPVLSLMCDRSDLIIKNILMVHDFTKPFDFDIQFIKKIIAQDNEKFHLLHIQSTNDSIAKEVIIQNMKTFALRNGIEQFECHIIQDGDVESGVVHFNEMREMDLVCIGTHGKPGLLHTSATEKLINHLYKPVLSFRITQ